MVVIFYFRYLDQYERIHFHGEEVSSNQVEEDTEERKRRACSMLHSIPLTYNHNMHNVKGNI